GAAVRYDENQLAAMGESTSKLEKRADEADRYVATFLKCTYLRERIGQTFLGLITTVVEFGCFVQILDVGVDGLLHLDNLRDDEYEMADNGHAWIGRRTRRQLRTGSHIRVLVTSANPIEGLIDLELAAEPLAEGDDAADLPPADARIDREVRAGGGRGAGDIRGSGAGGGRGSSDRGGAAGGGGRG